MKSALSAPTNLSHQHTPAIIASWLSRGWQDYRRRPVISVFYGVGFSLLSWIIVIALSLSELHWALLPSLSGAMLVGPLIAVGLYQISRQINSSSAVKIEAPGQILLIGAILMVLVLIWIRAATILFALFYGLKPFPGFIDLLQTLFPTSSGFWLIFVGSLVGGLFAAFSFAITVFSMPMLVSEPIDAFTAMGRSFSASVRHFGLIWQWAAIITGLAFFGFLSGMILMVIIFPLLGYASWHAYCDVFEPSSIKKTAI